jgi:hypothetical protein
VRRTHRIPFKVERSSDLGRPVLAGLGSIGLMRLHCASVKSEDIAAPFLAIAPTRI